MLLGYIKCLEDERNMLNPVLYKALEILKNLDFTNVELGKYVVNDGIFYSVTEFNTEMRDKRKPESHSKYVDIQYLISGEEIIGFTKLNGEAKVTENLLAEKDVVFYDNIPSESDILMNAGSYSVFFPWDIHRPGCAVGQSVRVRKVVLKVEKGLLKL